MLFMTANTIFLGSCSQEDDYYDDEMYTLAEPMITRNGQIETQAFQTYGTSNSLYNVPQNKSECMLYAIISIATKKGIPITYQIPDGQGGYTQTIKKIGKEGFSASDAYAQVKLMATSKSWVPCDVYGNPIPNEEPYRYTEGEMAPSIAATIGKQSGILKGHILYFESYKALQTYMSTDSFNIQHPSGTYIINSTSGRHATVGRGVDKNGNVKYYDAEYTGKYKPEQQIGSWTLIY